MEKTLSLEEKFVDLLVLVDYALLLARKMQLPVHEHGISICDSWFSVFYGELVEIEETADDTGEVDQVGEGAEDGRFILKVSSFVFRKCPRARDDLTVC